MLSQFRSARRTLSSSSIPVEIDAWIKSITSRPPEIHHDVIDVERASQIQRALPTRQDDSFIDDLKEGTPLPKGHHLIFFRPKSMLRDLGPDGSSTEHNAPFPYSRRMWAGGSFSWTGSKPETSLKVGAPATQVTTVPKVEKKKDMVFVHQQRVLYPGIRYEHGDDDWAVKEIRTHVFRRSVTMEKNVSSAPVSSSRAPSIALPHEQPDYHFAYTPTSPLLFLFSALTHNAHKVHYDQEWTTTKEGHPSPLVHGPLTALLLVELAATAQGEGNVLKHFDYRATSPIYLDKEVQLSAWRGDGGHLQLGAQQGSSVGMTANARLVHA